MQESPSLISAFHWITMKAYSKFSNSLTIFFKLDFPILTRYRVLTLGSLGTPRQECFIFSQLYREPAVGLPELFFPRNTPCAVFSFDFRCMIKPYSHACSCVRPTEYLSMQSKQEIPDAKPEVCTELWAPREVPSPITPSHCQHEGVPQFAQGQAHLHSEENLLRSSQRKPILTHSTCVLAQVTTSRNSKILQTSPVLQKLHIHSSFCRLSFIAVRKATML